MTNRILYPQLQAPVLTKAQEPENVTESRWHQPWSEPVRFKVVPALLSASGSSEAVYTDRIEPGAYEPWFAPLSEPVRVPPRLNTALNPPWFGSIVRPVPTILMSYWFASLSDPVRVPLRLAAALNEFYYGIPGEAVPIIASDMPWFAWLSEPVRVPKRLLEAIQFDPRFTRFVPPSPPSGVNLPLFTPPQQVNSQGGYYPADLWSGRLNPNG